MATEQEEFTSRVSEYEFVKFLKYGCNPHQKPAAILQVKGTGLPFKILNGNPGYINFQDALNSWQLVLELKKSLGKPAAASFKHVSPAGAAVAAELTEELVDTYELGTYKMADGTPIKLTPSALAYIRARNADPKSSFGDFAALSHKVDVATATFLQKCVCDGIIAPGYDAEALAILKTKKKGNFVILEGDESYTPPTDEYRELFGVVMYQKRNDCILTKENSCTEIVTENKELPEAAKEDMILAGIATKYTQSNSVCFAVNGQVIGVGAGQQSRVDCVKIAREKARIWCLRQHPKVRALKFKTEYQDGGTSRKVTRSVRTNARIAYIEGDMTDPEYKCWCRYFDEVPEPLSAEEKQAFVTAFTDDLKAKKAGITLYSDAFFPFRDNIDQASKIGVQYVLQAGGSRGDGEVTQACNDYGMVMCHNGIRVFHH